MVAKKKRPSSTSTKRKGKAKTAKAKTAKAKTAKAKTAKAKTAKAKAGVKRQRRLKGEAGTSRTGAKSRVHGAERSSRSTRPHPRDHVDDLRLRTEAIRERLSSTPHPVSVLPASPSAPAPTGPEMEVEIRRVAAGG